ncbi:hypothetical protein GEV39_22260 [Pseudomonas sp. NY5710]|nr:hypothetical protein GEV39_22260 [Pseudomonas sp. NY5710]
MKSLRDSLWERACPRSRRRGVWQRLRRCSRALLLRTAQPVAPFTTYSTKTIDALGSCLTNKW